MSVKSLSLGSICSHSKYKGLLWAGNTAGPWGIQGRRPCPAQRAHRRGRDAQAHKRSMTEAGPQDAEKNTTARSWGGRARGRTRVGPSAMMQLETTVGPAHSSARPVLLANL